MSVCEWCGAVMEHSHLCAEIQRLHRVIRDQSKRCQERVDRCVATADEEREKKEAALLQNDALKRLEAVVRYEHEGSCKSPSCGICLELQRPALKRVEPVPTCAHEWAGMSHDICAKCGVRWQYPMRY